MAMKVYQDKDQPIIRSLFDDDVYKAYMQQLAVKKHMAVEVRVKFLCRDAEDLVPYMQEIREQVKMVGDMSFTDDQLAFMENSVPGIKRSYVRGYLRMFKMFPNDVHISVIDGQLSIEAKGIWASVMRWEIIILAIVSEVRNRNLHPDVTMDDVRKQLHTKVEKFKSMAEEQGICLKDFFIADFGTRRRLSFNVQFAVVDYLQHAFKENFVGTSNLHIARELGIKAIGTQAHEIYQTYQALEGVRLIDHQKVVMQDWAEEYRGTLGIALTDCISIDAFLRDFDLYFATLFQGLRHDSGCPYIWGDKAITHYEKLGIDPKTKTLVFSDGLKLDETTLALYAYFKDRINVSFGIGTNLTCDIPGIKPMNIVMKIVEANGQHVAKLSDSPGKTMCESEVYVANLKETFNHGK